MPIKIANSHFDSIIRNADGSISIRKVPRKAQKGAANINVARSKKNSSNSKLGPKFSIYEGRVVIDLPLRTKSEANCFEHWRVKHQRHKAQQAMVASQLKQARKVIRLPCKILCVRLAPHKLDKHDNLPMSFKYIVDTCCAIITENFVAGKADSDERITIAYDQEISKEYGVRIEVTYSPS